MKWNIFFSIVVVMVPLNAMTQNAIKSQSDAFNSGKEFANTGKNEASNTVNSDTGTKNLPYYSTSAPESDNYQNGRNLIGNAGMQKQNHCKTYQAPTEFDQQECDAVNFMSENPTTRVKYTIDKENDPLMVASKGVIDDPGSIAGVSSQQCRVEKVTNPATYITETCTETQTLENLSCKRVLKVTCDPPTGDGCDQGGIVPNSWAGDMASSFTASNDGNYILQFGTIQDNYWNGYATLYDRTLTFNVTNVHLITRFALTRASFDDWLLVKVNDHTVYVGPHGGDRLELDPLLVNQSQLKRTRECQQSNNGSWTCRDKNTGENPKDFVSCAVTGVGWACVYANYQLPKIKYCDTCLGAPELKNSWDFGLNVDVRPYLKDGQNTIFMRTIVSGGGEGATQFTTRQACPRNCNDEWDDSQCASLESRTR